MSNSCIADGVGTLFVLSVVLLYLGFAAVSIARAKIWRRIGRIVQHSPPLLPDNLARDRYM